VGFGGWAGPPEPIQVALALTTPWQPDAQLDALVAELPSARTGGASFDGRKPSRKRHRASK
jgi:hypothetical protein